MANVFKQFFEIPRIVRNAEGNYVKDGTNRFNNNQANVEAFRNALIAHERLHCVQYRMLAEAFFLGEFPSGITLPFYSTDPKFTDILLWDGGTKTLADKVCDASRDYSCCKISGGCETPECNKHIETLKNEIAGKTADLIRRKTKPFYKEIEVPAWHYVFLLMQNYLNSQNE